MIALGPLALLRPWWLLVLPAIVLIFVLSRPRGGTLAGWEKAADPHLLSAMVARGATGGGGVRAPWVLATLVLGILALSGPAVQRAGHDRLRNLDATVLAIDVSQDMASGGAIREAAAAAHDLLQHTGARQAGLIVYAGDAYIASALTDYSGGIDADLFSLDDTTVPDPGARPDRALALAHKMLEEAHIISGDVILVSSGGGLDGAAADRAAQSLAAAGHRVYAMSVKAGARRAAALQRVAAAGDGFAVDIGQPARLYDVLEDEAIARIGNSAVASLDWRDLGRYLLILAALPLLLGFRKAVAA